MGTAGWVLALGLAFASPLTAAELTAFQLIEEGNQYVSVEAKNRVVQIRSEKSVGTLEPMQWAVVYYDPDARAKATEVKFVAGKKVSVRRPGRLLEPIFGKHRELAKDKLKVDSDKAIEIALAEPALKNLKPTNTELKLEGEGDEYLPVWKVRLWVEKVRRPEDTVSIGELHISAEDGKVLENKLRIDRAD